MKNKKESDPRMEEYNKIKRNTRFIIFGGLMIIGILGYVAINLYLR